MASLEPARATSIPLAPSHSLAASILEYTLKLYPLILLVVFIVCGVYSSIATARSEETVDSQNVSGPDGKPLPATKRRGRPREQDDDIHNSPQLCGPLVSPTFQRVFIWFSLAIFLTFFATGLAHFIHFIQVWPALKNGQRVWEETEEMTVYLVGGTNFHLYCLVTLIKWRDSPSVVHFITWTLALVGELAISLCSSFLLQGRPVGGTSTVHPFGNPDGGPITKWEMIDLSLSLLRLASVFALVSLYSILWVRQACLDPGRLAHGSEYDLAGEAAPLLNGSRASYRTHNGHHDPSGRQANGRASHGNRNGNAVGRPKDSAAGTCLHQDEQAAFYRPEKMPRKTWWEYIRGYSLFFQYLYPKKSWKLQALCLVCVLLLLLQRVVNVLVPLQVGRLTDSLATGDGDAWGHLAVLVGLKLLQGESMLLGSLRSILWMPVSQYSYRALTTSAFEHVHSLSLDFHLGKRTGEVLSALNKGASINQFLEQISFQVVPMILDLTLAIGVFEVVYGMTYASIVSCIAFWYLYLTVEMAQTRADQRRIMTNADREEEAVKNDSITSYETVKYFNAERWEFTRYRNAIKLFQAAEKEVTKGMNKMSSIQALVFMGGLTIVLVVGTSQVHMGTRTVGEFVTLLTYLGQLQTPLNFFSTFYRTIQQSMISGERLLELFKIKPTVVDAPEAKKLMSCQGHIRWANVGFAYEPRQPALQSLDFECRPGSTTAFVGESGGGKSTIFRLMFRYYNPTTGRIEIDGQDVTDFTIDSVRKYIGVVPQDTTLFNETLMYNLKYANPDATDDQVYDACRAAAIHERIISFPAGYNTKVGDRGLRLSGGERQRVAIARTILKDPKIIMLDEATSALDAHTEQEIQNKLGNLGHGRTLLIIAHRLSTITHADQIVVLNKGSIVEKGTHEELVAANGRYASMWQMQVQAERAAEKARQAHRKAHKLMRKANIAHDTHGERQPDGYNSLASSAILPGGNASGPNGRGHVEDSSSSSNSSDTDSTHAGDAEHR